MMRSLKSFIPYTKRVFSLKPHSKYFSSCNVLLNTDPDYAYKPPFVRLHKTIKDVNPDYKEQPTTGLSEIRDIPTAFESVVGKERIEMMYPEVWDKLLPEIVSVELGVGRKVTKPILVPTWGQPEAIIGCIGDCFDKDTDFETAQFKWTVLDANHYGICAQCGLLFYAITPEEYTDVMMSREVYQWFHRRTKELIEEAKEILKDENGFEERFSKFKEKYDQVAPFFATNMLDFYTVHDIVDFPKTRIPKEGESIESISFETTFGNSREALEEFVKYNTNVVLLKLAYPLFEVALFQIKGDQTPISPYRIHEQVKEIDSGKQISRGPVKFENFADFVKQTYEQYASQAANHKEPLHRTGEGLATFFKNNYGKDISLSNTAEAFEAMYKFIVEEGWPAHLKFVEKIENRRKPYIKEDVVQEEEKPKDPERMNVQILFA